MSEKIEDISKKVYDLLMSHSLLTGESGTITINPSLVSCDIANYISREVDRKKEIMTVDETAEFLNMSKARLYQLTMKKKIPFYKPSGKLIYFNRTEIERWVYGLNFKVGLSEI